MKPAVAAVGAGRMGRGIAHVFAYAGHPVTLVDFKPRSAEDFAALAKAGLAEIESNLRFLAELGVFDAALVPAMLALIRIVPREAAATALAGAALVWEGVPERLPDKQAALAAIGDGAPADAIVASTTSSILVTDLAPFIARPQRFLNAHFLNPAFLIPLVEVSPSPQTDEAVTAALIDWLGAVGKVPVRCAASPGYIIPRLQSLLLSETARMVEEGVATPADIDKAIMHGFGPRYATMGTVEFIDWGGVDIVYYAGGYLAKALNSPRHAAPPSVAAMMEEGRKGMREGRGYYDYGAIDVAAYQRDKLARFVRLLGQLGQLPKPGLVGD